MKASDFIQLRYDDFKRSIIGAREGMDFGQCMRQVEQHGCRPGEMGQLLKATFAAGVLAGWDCQIQITDLKLEDDQGGKKVSIV